MSDDAVARELDDRLLRAMHAFGARGESLDDDAFDALARDIAAYQLERNEPYRRFAATLGIDAAHPPATWRDVPAVPASAFKDATLATFAVAGAEAVFHTSGTTADVSGKHYVERAALYDAALLAGFDRFMLADGARLRYLNLVPDPRAKPHSSLGYMMGHVSVLRGDGRAGSFLGDDRVDVDGFARALDAAIAVGQPVCVAGTAFAFVALVDELAARGRSFAAPAGSRVMETGGFKGRVRAIERTELYAMLEAALGIARDAIVAEYGMTELLSQFYDTPRSRAAGERVKAGPPWLRTLVVDDAGAVVPDGGTGFLRHVDLANRSSVIAIDTEDRGFRTAEGIVLLGREIAAPPRGCSLDAEDLVSMRRA